MLPWQKNHIDRNINKLIEHTLCNVSLLAFLRGNGVISQEEYEILSDENKTGLGRSCILYDCIKTRTGAFEMPKEALRESRQSGALEILSNAQEDDELYRKYCVLTFEDQSTHQGSCDNFTLHRGNFGNREALVKIFNNAATSNLEQVKNELDILTSVDRHESIVRCYTAKFVIRGFNESFAIALDYQMNLVQFSRSKDTTSMFSELMSQILHGVKFLHQRRIIHVNLKAESILISLFVPEHPKIKIGEFGLAKRLFPNQVSCFVSLETLYENVSACFETPEVLQRAHGIDFADKMREVNIKVSCQTDVFCLGVVLNFVLSAGKHAFGCLIDKRTNVRLKRIQVEETYFSVLSSVRREALFGLMSPDSDRRPVLDSLTSIF